MIDTADINFLAFKSELEVKLKRYQDTCYLSGQDQIPENLRSDARAWMNNNVYKFFSCSGVKSQSGITGFNRATKLLQELEQIGNINEFLSLIRKPEFNQGHIMRNTILKHIQDTLQISSEDLQTIGKNYKHCFMGIEYELAKNKAPYYERMGRQVLADMIFKISHTPAFIKKTMKDIVTTLKSVLEPKNSNVQRSPAL